MSELEARIQRLRGLHEKATPGEWEPGSYHPHGRDIRIRGWHDCCIGMTFEDHDALFIVNAHNEMSALLEEMERLRARLDKALFDIRHYPGITPCHLCKHRRKSAEEKMSEFCRLSNCGFEWDEHAGDERRAQAEAAQKPEPIERFYAADGSWGWDTMPPCCGPGEIYTQAFEAVQEGGGRSAGKPHAYEAHFWQNHPIKTPLRRMPGAAAMVWEHQRTNRRTQRQGWAIMKNVLDGIETLDEAELAAHLGEGMGK